MSITCPEVNCAIGCLPVEEINLSTGVILAKLMMSGG